MKVTVTAPHRVLLATDDSEAARNAEACAHAEIAQAAAARLRSHGIQATAEVYSGDPATEIIAAASAFGADLIVLGSRGQTGLRRIVLGSVARKVLYQASASILIVRTGTTPTSAGV